jgi:PIN domain nuclease of toxin-antitoxin system
MNSIAAQALTESMSVGIKDNIIEKYGVKVIW